MPRSVKEWKTLAAPAIAHRHFLALPFHASRSEGSMPDHHVVMALSHPRKGCPSWSKRLDSPVSFYVNRYPQCPFPTLEPKSAFFCACLCSAGPSSVEPFVTTTAVFHYCLKDGLQPTYLYDHLDDTVVEDIRGVLCRASPLRGEANANDTCAACERFGVVPVRY